MPRAGRPRRREQIVTHGSGGQQAGTSQSGVLAVQRISTRVVTRSAPLLAASRCDRHPRPQVRIERRISQSVQMAAKRPNRDSGSRGLLDVLRHPIAALTAPFREGASATVEDRRAASGPEGRLVTCFVCASFDPLPGKWKHGGLHLDQDGARWAPGFLLRGGGSPLPSPMRVQSVSRSHGAAKSGASNPASSRSSRQLPSGETFALPCRETASPWSWSVSRQGNTRSFRSVGVALQEHLPCQSGRPRGPTALRRLRPGRRRAMACASDRDCACVAQRSGTVIVWPGTSLCRK